jgi:hypothetical protein
MRISKLFELPAIFVIVLFNRSDTFAGTDTTGAPMIQHVDCDKMRALVGI